MRNLTLFLLSIFFLACCSVSASAQYRQAGKVNIWTTGTVSRLKAPDGQLRIVRAARQKDFDRVVFQFADGVPSFTVAYTDSPVYDEFTGASVSISGSAVIEVVFHFDQGQTAEIYKGYPKGKLNLPVLLEIKDTDGTHGRMAFALGLRARHRFRVQTLRNPARLLVDIKH